MTDYLVVGKEPGASKVNKARVSTRTQIISLEQLRKGLVAGDATDLASGEKLAITNYSAGYRSFGNGWQGNAVAPLLDDDPRLKKRKLIKQAGRKGSKKKKKKQRMY